MADANYQEDPFISADDGFSKPASVKEAITSEDESVSSGLSSLIMERYTLASTARQEREARWRTAYQNFAGVTGRDVKLREQEVSKIFLKITKTKVLAGFGMIVDILFANGKFPITVAPSNRPKGISSKYHVSKEGPPEQQEEQEEVGFGYSGDGRTLNPDYFLGKAKNKFIEELKKDVKGLKEGPSTDGGPEVDPAKIAARNLEKVILDQLEETDGNTELLNAIFECTLLGTSAVKGPLNIYRDIHSWKEDENGERTYEPEQILVPKLEFVSVWDLFPDPYATSVNEMEWVIQRHKMNRSQLRELIKRPLFRKDAIVAAIEAGFNYVYEDYEQSIKQETGDNFSTIGPERYEVLEYWGSVDASMLKDLNIDISDDVDAMEEVSVNIWYCNGQILRVAVNPFKPKRIPYNIFPYEKDPYSIWGIGVAENMEDTQMSMNGHVRMAVDNLALAGNLVFDIDESALVPGQSMSIYPGKIFRRQSGMPGQAIYGVKFPSTAPDNMQMFDRMRQLADEVTGIPSYSHGYTGVTGMTRTASGMSMLMGAASLNVKTVIKNIDHYLLQPLAEAMFQWNYQFNDEIDIVGDLEIKASGSAGLMKKEVRSQRLTQLLQTVSNPAIAPFVKMPTLVREIAYSLDLDPDELTNDADMIAIMQQQLSGQQGAPQQGGAPGMPAPPMPGVSGPNPTPAGAPPMPEEAGFSGAPQ